VWWTAGANHVHQAVMPYVAHVKEGPSTAPIIVDLALAVLLAAGLEGEDLQVAREVLQLS
jgi:hypothetical protein